MNETDWSFDVFCIISLVGQTVSLASELAEDVVEAALASTAVSLTWSFTQVAAVAADSQR